MLIGKNESIQTKLYVEQIEYDVEKPQKNTEVDSITYKLAPTFLHKYLNTELDGLTNCSLLDSTVVKTEITISEQRFEGNSLPVKLNNADGIFALLFISFLMLAYIFADGISYLAEKLQLVFSSSVGKQDVQKTSKETLTSFFLLSLFSILISIASYEVLDRTLLSTIDQKTPFTTTGLFVILIAAFLFFKLVLNKLVGYIFDIQNEIAKWNRTYSVMLGTLALLFFPCALLLVYSELKHEVIIGVMLILFLFVQIILFIKLIFFFVQQKFNILYLIAYLCTMEIIPYMFLGMGLVYLYQIDIFNTIL